jgi:predicted permease
MNLWLDLRHGARLLRLNPGFAVVAILSLALGIGANTAIFQLLDAVRLRSLPVSKPGELAELKIAGGNQGMGINEQYGELSRPVWELIAKQHEPFSGVFGWSIQNLRAGAPGEERPVRGLVVTGDFFSVLGVQPWRGRLLQPEDASACDSRGVASYAYWQAEMGGRELGPDSKVLVDGRVAQIIGVTPPGFFGMVVGEGFDLAAEYCPPEKNMRADIFDMAVMGRLRPGWTLARASAYFGAASSWIFGSTPLPDRDSSALARYRRFRLAAYPAGGGVSGLRQTYDSSLWLLLAITGLVLLIACANLANLMLARASIREREIAVRLALGASRRRLIRQLLVESGMLSLLGAALGIGLAQALSRILVAAISSPGNRVVLNMGTDWRVLCFTAGIAVLTCVIFGVAPALRASNAEPVTAMKVGGRGLTAGRERFSLQRLMVVTQISVSLILLIGALLFVRSFRNLMTFNPGMRESGITVSWMNFFKLHVPPAQQPEFRERLLEQIRNTPGVIDAALASHVPLIGSSWGHTIQIGAAKGESTFSWVSPSYFRTMDIPVLAGRGFNSRDTAESTRVAVVNQDFVRRYLNGASPLGRTLRTAAEPDYPSTVYEIVGVIPDTQYNDLRSPVRPMTFAPASQFPAPRVWTGVMIRSDIPVETAVKRNLAQWHPEITVEFHPFQTMIREGMLAERLMAMLSGFFGALAALLAMLGLYGVISYLVARRQNEIGIRLALGARRSQVIGMVMQEAAWMLAAGVVIGTGLSLIAARTAGSLLFGVKSCDPQTLVAGAFLLSAVAVAASYLPARRASKLDPMCALRCE